MVETPCMKKIHLQWHFSRHNWPLVLRTLWTNNSVTVLIMLQSLSITAALLPSLQAQYKMDQVNSTGVTGSKAKFTIDLPQHSLSFTTKLQVHNVSDVQIVWQTDRHTKLRTARTQGMNVYVSIWMCVIELPWLISNLMHKILIYLRIIHLLKFLYMFRALPCSSSGGLHSNCIYAASGIVTVCRWLSCAPVKKECECALFRAVLCLFS